MGIWDAVKTMLGGQRAAGDADEGFVPEPKAPPLVVRRFTQLVLMASLADTMVAGKHPTARELQKAVLDHLVALGFTPRALEAVEQQLVFGLRSGQIEQSVVQGASWRLECAHVLAWALGLRALDADADLDSLRAALPADAAALEAMGTAATVRPLGELLAARHTWSLRAFEPLPPGDERSQILERMRALRWLTEPEHQELTAISMRPS